jgi:GT2 family glycosyltransferase
VIDPSSSPIDHADKGTHVLGQGPDQAISHDNDTTEFPFVSVIVPCFNEVDHITACLSSILSSTYPHDRMEVLVIDGLSTDGTRDRVHELETEDTRVRLIDNPKRIKPVAFNVGVRESVGELIMIVGGHSTYPEDYVELCVKYLLEWNADNVGGVVVASPRKQTLSGISILAVQRSRLGLGGGAITHNGEGPEWVRTVFGGCYRRSVFEQCGSFDERLLRGQDREFNFRISRAGRRILRVPQIKSYYFTRSDFREHIRWSFAAGMTPFYIARLLKDKDLVSLRNVLPAIALAGVCVLSAAAIWWAPAAVLLGLPLIAYAVLILGAGLSTAMRYGKAGPIVGVPWTFALTHLSYALGCWFGILKPIKDGRPWVSV